MCLSNKNLKIPGIYCLYNQLNERRYIGSAKNILKRVREHRSFLSKSKHWNKFLQSDWNKCGEEAFQVLILEKVLNIEFLASKEQKWIDRYYDNQKNCYNIQPTVDRSIGIPHSEETKRKISKKLKNHPGIIKAKSKMWNVDLVSPDGVVYSNIENLEQFSRTHNLNSCSLWNLINGKLLTYKNWRLYNTPKKEILLQIRGEKISISKLGRSRPDVALRHTKTYDVKLISPNGEIFGPIVGVSNFARKHKLLIPKLCKLLNGKCKSHKGWTIYK